MSTLAAPAPAAAAPDVERWLERAEHLAERGRERRATALLRRLDARAPGHPGVAEQLARVLLPQTVTAEAARPSPPLRERATEAREAIERALAEPPEERAALRRLQRLRAWAVALGGDHREAIDRVGAMAGRLDTASAGWLQRLAALAVRRHDLEAADRALGLARRADAEDETLLSDRAAVALARGRAELAITLLRRALTRRPEDVALRRDLGGALLAAGRSDEAVDELAAVAAECDRSTARCHVDLARAALEAGRADRAIAAAREALARAGRRDPEPALLLGLALVAAERPDDAIAPLRRALARDPAHIRARRVLDRLQPRTPPASEKSKADR